MRTKSIFFVWVHTFTTNWQGKTYWDYDGKGFGKRAFRKLVNSSSVIKDDSGDRVFSYVSDEDTNFGGEHWWELSFAVYTIEINAMDKNTMLFNFFKKHLRSVHIEGQEWWNRDRDTISGGDGSLGQYVTLNTENRYISTYNERKKIKMDYYFD